MKARYTDGTLVDAGDRVRYHQQPGGLLSPETDVDGNVKWHYGTAETLPWYQEPDIRERMLDRMATVGGVDPDELHCRYDDPHFGSRYGHMAPHVIERA